MKLIMQGLVGDIWFDEFILNSFLDYIQILPLRR